MGDKSLEQRITDVEFIVAQLTEKFELYLPQMSDLQKVSVTRLHDKVDNLKESYSRLTQRCQLETEKKDITKDTIKTLAANINEINHTQTDLAKEVVKISTEITQIKSDIDSINVFIHDITNSSWRIIEKFGPTVAILLYLLWEYFKAHLS